MSLKEERTGKVCVIAIPVADNFNSPTKPM